MRLLFAIVALVAAERLRVESLPDNRTAQHLGAHRKTSSQWPQPKFKTSPSSISKSAPEDSCPLPAAAKWCSLHGMQMACYENGDIVCNAICSSGDWENVGRFAPLFRDLEGKTMVDIGANVGTYSFIAAQQGMTVEAFEAMPSNHALIEATLCRNPGLRVKLHKVALSDSPEQKCYIVSGSDNVGDGILCCGKSEDECTGPNYKSRSAVTTSTLTDIIAVRKTEGIPPIAYVKMDVEGAEYRVLKGSPDFLTSEHPQFIQSEVWRSLQDSTPEDYLGMFKKAGYAVSHGFFDKNKHDGFGCKTECTIDEVFMMDPGSSVDVAKMSQPSATRTRWTPGGRSRWPSSTTIPAATAAPTLLRRPA